MSPRTKKTTSVKRSKAAASKRAKGLGGVGAAAAQARYPIEDFEGLVQALGGGNVSITIRGAAMPLSAARAHVPAYYFPIGSAPDLLAKIADLRELGGRSEHDFVAEWRGRRSEHEQRAPADCWA